MSVILIGRLSTSATVHNHANRTSSLFLVFSVAKLSTFAFVLLQFSNTLHHMSFPIADHRNHVPPAE